MNYETILNQKIQGIQPSGIRKFFDILEEMKDAISLGIGEPDFVTPWHIRDAGIYSLERGYTKYPRPILCLLRTAHRDGGGCPGLCGAEGREPVPPDA